MGGEWHVAVAMAVERLPRRAGGWADREDYSCGAAASASRYVRFSMSVPAAFLCARVCACV